MGVVGLACVLLAFLLMDSPSDLPRNDFDSDIEVVSSPVATPTNARGAEPIEVDNGNTEDPAGETNAEDEGSESALHVTVIVPSGNPQAGVMVELVRRELIESPSLGGLEAPWELVQRETTSSRGVVLFDVAAMRERDSSRDLGEVKFQYQLQATDSLSRRVTKLLKSTPVAGQRETIQLLGFGRLRVNVLDQSGSAPQIQSRVNVSWVIDDGMERRAAGPDNSPQDVDASGMASFENLPLGAMLHVEAYVIDDTLEPGAIDIEGPKEDGQTMQCTVTLGPERPRFVGRVVGPDGDPLKRARLIFAVWQHGGMPTESTERLREPKDRVILSTDEEGRIDFTYGTTKLVEHARYALLMTGDARGRKGSGFTRIELPKELQSGIRNLGDQELHPLPMFASGVVEDDEGQPLCGAWVMGLARRSGDRNNKWWPLHGVGLRTDEFGCFELRYAGELDEVAIRVSAKDFEAVQFNSFERGEENLIVRLEHASSSRKVR